MTRSCAPMALGGKLVLNLALTAPLQHTNTEMLHVRNRLMHMPGCAPSYSNRSRCGADTETRRDRQRSSDRGEGSQADVNLRSGAQARRELLITPCRGGA